MRIRLWQEVQVFGWVLMRSFDPSATVYWNGQPLSTTYHTYDWLTVEIPSNYLDILGDFETVALTVQTQHGTPRHILSL